MRVQIPKLILPLLFVSACDGKDGKVDTGDIQDTDPSVVYDEGCILVDGEGGYQWLADAITVADSGSTITLCDGEINESVTIDKPVTLEGPEDEELIWNAETNMAALTIQGAEGVVVRNVSIRSTRNGINIDNAVDTLIENVQFLAIGGTGARAVDATNTTFKDCYFGQLEPPPFGGDTGSDTGWDTGLDTDTDTDTGEADTSGDTSGDTGGDTGEVPTTDLPGYGGLEISGGSATAQENTFSQLVGFGIHITDGAQAELIGNTISWVTYGEITDDGGVSDGFGLWADKGGEITTSGNLLFRNFIGIVADESDATLSGDSVVGGGYGVYALRGAFDFTDVSVEEAYSVGVLTVASTDPVVMNGVSVRGTPEYVHPGGEGDGNSTGIQVQASEATLSNLTVEGYNAMGIALVPYNNTLDVTLTDTTVLNAGRMGLYASQSNLVIENLNVDGMRMVDDPETVNVGGSISTGFAASFWYSTVDWNKGSVTNSEFIGLLNALSTITLGTDANGDGVEIAGNWYHGIWNYEGTLSISGASFTRSAGYYGLSAELYPYTSGLYATNATTIVDASHFHDNRETRYYEYTNNGQVIGVETAYASQDIRTHAGILEVTNTIFETGSMGIDISETETEITGCTWTDYNEAVIDAWSNSSSPLVVEDAQMTNVGSDVISCNYGGLDIRDVTITTAAGILNDTTTWIDGSQVDQSSYTYEYPTVSTSDCTLYVNGLEITDSSDQALRALGGEVELYDVTVTGGGSGNQSSDAAVEIEYSSGTPSVYVAGLTVSGHETAPGLRISSSSSTEGSVSVTDAVISGSGSYGIAVGPLPGSNNTFSEIESTANASDGFYLSDAEVVFGQEDATDPANNTAGLHSAYNSGHGLYVVDSTVNAVELILSDNIGSGAVVNSSTTDLAHLTVSSNGFGGTSVPDGILVTQGASVILTEAAITGSAANGLAVDSSSSVDIDSSSSTWNGSHGIEGTDATLSISNTTLEGNVLSGLNVTNCQVDTLDNSTFTSNTEYGMVCDVDSTFASCTGNTFTTNTLGDSSGCDAVTCN
ncbi:MAG: right-handed parallel beta-helix repeat-containing protein [Myxococcota bacterium]|nr:right-handed parallel beta-helix repeat-containing protein [Myxococcota bacterium]